VPFTNYTGCFMRLNDREKYVATVACRTAVRELEAYKKKIKEQTRLLIGMMLPVLAFVLSSFWFFRTEIIHFLVKEPFKERVEYYVDVADEHRKKNSEKFLAEMFEEAATSAAGFQLMSLDMQHVPKIKERADEINSSVPSQVWETLATGNKAEVHRLVSNENFIRALFDQRADAWKVFDIHTPSETLRQEIRLVGGNTYEAQVVMLEASRDGNPENCGGNFNQNEHIVILQDHDIDEDDSIFRWARCYELGWPKIYLKITTPNMAGDRDYVEARLIGVRSLNSDTQGPRLVVTKELAKKMGFSEAQINNRTGNIQSTFTLSRLE